MSNLRFGAGLWMFGQFVDRYAADAYGPPVNTLEAIALAGSVGGLEVVDINYPFGDGITVQQVKDAFDKAKLRAYAVTPHIYMQEYVRGAFTNPDASVRRKAIDRCKAAIDVARQLNPKYVKFWPGQDGYDYPFQADYAQLWDYSVSAVRELAQFAPDLQFAIECKFKEPRTHITPFCNVATTLLAIQDVGVQNVGIVMDVGHSFFAKETPAEAVQLAHRFGKLTSVEINDNWREWDDDMAVGSVHLIESLEYMLALRKIGWKDPILLDQFPFREDPVRAARASLNTIRRLDALLDRIDLKALQTAQDHQDALAAQQLVLNEFLS
ncbi:MAG: sugar phosphate isomerase/epimerase [Anaerolineae bacterium]|nr:sugar phosphate isomerase/epimerase [Anaerolineae bacterium]